ncbi:MAG: DUF4831 family protein [Prevotella sp.]|nr:DUF4831 family protein [Prevotella sp.]
MRRTKTTRFVQLLTAFLLVLLACPAVSAQTQLTGYRPGATPEGAVYYLPKTALRISVLVEKTTYQPGDFSPFAQRYLRMNDVSQQPATSYRVVSIRQTPMPAVDTTKVYAVRFDARSVAARVSLTEDGRLLGLNVDDAADVEAPAPFVPAPREEWVNPRQYLSEEIISCGSTAKMAELTAHEIYDLRENHNLLIKGQADFMPQDGAQMKLMLNELSRQDKALSSLFVGRTQRDTTEHILWVDPAVGGMERTVLFRLSQLHGLVEADDLSGAPYYIMVEDISQLPAPAPEEKKKKGKADAGIYVNVPGRLRSTVFEGINTVITNEFPAPQFGHTLLLSGDLFNKRYATRLHLNALTGAVERLDADQPK